MTQVENHRNYLNINDHGLQHTSINTTTQKKKKSQQGLLHLGVADHNVHGRYINKETSIISSLI